MLHGEMWQRCKAQGYPIISSWIYEAEYGATESMTELWSRIQSEIAQCFKVVLFANPEEFPLKGALIEVGMALGMSKTVVVCLPGVKLDERCRPIGSWITHPLVRRIDDLLGALDYE